VKQLRFYITRLRMNIGQKSKPVGIPWLPGPGLHDLYPKPQMAFCWHQPGNMPLEEVHSEKSAFRGWFSKFGTGLKVKG